MVERRTLRAHRWRATLATGIALGVFAAVYLSGWNDLVVAGSQAESPAELSLLANVGNGWDRHSTSNTAAVLHFGTDAIRISPGKAVYAPISVKLSPPIPDTDETAELYLRGPSVVHDASTTHALRYTVKRDVPHAQCNVDAFDRTGYTPTGFAVRQPLTVDSGTSFIRLPLSGEPIDFCVKVELPYNTTLRPGSSPGQAHWEFVAIID
ncbi:hypothetical protein IEU95_14930 [Hoyosella rhizosphaerae]|uniref:Ribosomally synthesized peptide with SipW-like signal peptide n=1 Tax=Hoyosella rhizosphaerae TaxID=1755582 RepID=A0A916UHK0_9ACTN|nr:hypothetical protein [Hoyosella rhizosphaerae]MBN4928132.1 hypothetical protein [Hoyosella rhizosphaerae]GGC72618.1 hypothetical protein GCM10011410_27130 [Hoyosella rhizosphaerae]